MYRRFEHLEKRLERELDNLNEKYKNGMEMTEGDLKRADMLSHTAKCLMAYEKMMAETNNQPDFSYQNSYNNSYAGNSYMDGNSYSYSREPMSQYSREMGPMSGHYPMMPPERRW